MTSCKNDSVLRKAPGKHNARIAAIQALYQMDITGRGAAGVVDEFLDQRLEEPLEYLDGTDIDRAFFAQLTKDVAEHQSKIDTAIRAKLSENWRLSRLDATLRALMRCACCELLVCVQAPAAVVLDEYVDISKLFFDVKETGFVNATLDAISKSQLD